MTPLRLQVPPGRANVRLLDETGSTNAEARTWAQTGAPDGACVVSDSQTAGRGRHGRNWHSPAGLNLYLSQVFTDPHFDLGLLPLLGGFAALLAIESFAGPEPGLGVKWPNDVLAKGAKLAGVLAERLDTPQALAVLGIGINVNALADDFPADLRRPATSLRLLTRNEVDRSLLLANLLDALEEVRALVERDPISFIERFGRRCLSLGRPVRICPPRGLAFDATARRIDPDGVLVVETHSGQLERILAGDVDPID